MGFGEDLGRRYGDSAVWRNLDEIFNEHRDTLKELRSVRDRMAYYEWQVNVNARLVEYYESLLAVLFKDTWDTMRALYRQGAEAHDQSPDST